MKVVYQPYLDKEIDLDEWTRQIIKWHFDPLTGSPFWQNKKKELGFDPVKEVQTFDDLAMFGLFNEKVLTKIPAKDLIPSGFRHAATSQCRVFETGGTLGAPKRIIDYEYRKQIAQWLSYSIDLHNFPRAGNWLHLGPAGPHVVGHSTGSLAHIRGGLCYYVDIDTRWIKICVKKGYDNILEEYLENVLLQATRILETQQISFICTTPKLLLLLVEKVSLKNIKGIIIGGTHVSPDLHRLLREEVIPGIPLCIVYGNTIMGVAPQTVLKAEDKYQINHYGFFPHFHADIVKPNNPSLKVDYGQKGRVKITTLTRDYFIPNLLERDEAIRIKGNNLFAWDGVANIEPFSQMSEEIIEGVY